MVLRIPNVAFSICAGIDGSGHWPGGDWGCGTGLLPMIVPIAHMFCLFSDLYHPIVSDVAADIGVIDVRDDSPFRDTVPVWP